MRDLSQNQRFYLLNEVLKGVLSGSARRVLYLLASLDVVPTSSADLYSLFFGYCGSREQRSAERSARRYKTGGLREDER